MAQEERFTRKKLRCAIEYCLSEGKFSLTDVENIVFRAAMPIWLKEEAIAESDVDYTAASK